MGATLYDPAIRATILQRLASGESLRAICRDGGMPNESTVRFWVVDDAEFATQYARARSVGIDAMAEETIEIADDRARDPNDRRVAVDARKWFASKMRPDKYGDKIAQEISGPGGGAIEVKNSVAELAARIDGVSDRLKLRG